jgi:CDP-6-deoxy-D-xylo-4-hexulose-3-dehydrase
LIGTIHLLHNWKGSCITDSRHQIGIRMLFGGNLLRQPGFGHHRHDRLEALRMVGEMLGSDQIMSRALFLGP